MSTSGAHTGRAHRGPRAPWYAGTTGASAPASHRAPTRRPAVLPTAASTAGRHLAPTESSPLVPVAKRAGVASLVTAVSMGGVALAQGGSTAVAGAEVASRYASVDFSASSRGSATSRDAGDGREAGPAMLRTFHETLTVLTIPKAEPTEAEKADTPAPKHRKAGPAITRELRIADTLDCDQPDAVSGFANGRIPHADLCTIPGTGQRLRTDAAAAFIALNAAYKEHFGSDIVITDSYRDLASQKSLFKRKPKLAAVPGTSQHGWGIAVDLGSGIESLGSDEHAWMLDNAPRFGWDNPSWARPGGSKLEPWHWEYTAPGTDSPS